MERIRRIDPAEDAALKRLLCAVALSLLLHALVVTAAAHQAGEKGIAASHDQSASPQFSVLSASLRSTAANARFRARVQIQTTFLPDNEGGVAALDARYYVAGELDVLPVPRNPNRLRALAPVPGSLRLLALIDASGRVTDVSVFEAATSDAQVAAAVSGLRRLAFVAARKHGRPVRSEVVIELTGC
jgi:hypothetical protein